MRKTEIQLPPDGLSRDEVVARMEALRAHDVRWQQGRVFSLVYHAGEEVEDILKTAYTMFFSENGLNPTAFPSLRRFETEVVAMVGNLLGGDERTVGNMTSGGTESILMAVKTARDWARVHRPQAKRPTIVMPSSAHPAFDKAGHYFGVRVMRVPVGDDFRVDPEAMRHAITPDTILLVGSAPSYPHGVVDPIPAIAAIAREHDLLLHVDACVGGMMLPFVRRLGYPVPDFDFRVPGVTSMSVDLHKYGYAAKGASVVLYRDKTLRRFQLFATTDWSGGIYASPTMTGTRPGGAIAAAWAVMQFLGEAGYLRLAREVMEAVERIKAGVEAIPGLYILGDPAMSILAIGGEGLDIYEVADEMALRGWHLDRQQFPACLHLTVHHGHTRVVDAFLEDLRASAYIARRWTPTRAAHGLLVRAANLLTRILPKRWVSWLFARASRWIGSSPSGLPERAAPMYGIMGTLPNRGDLHNLVLDLVEGFTEPE